MSSECVISLPAPKLAAKRIPFKEASIPAVGIPGAQTSAQYKLPATSAKKPLKPSIDSVNKIIQGFLIWKTSYFCYCFHRSSDDLLLQKIVNQETSAVTQKTECHRVSFAELSDNYFCKPKHDNGSNSTYA